MSSTLASLAAPSGKSLQSSDDFLKAKHNLLAQFDSVDSLVTHEEKVSERDRRAIEHHILKLRAALARKLWANEIYIGRSLLDNYVLRAAKTGGGGVLEQVITGLAAAGAEHPGFVLYPLTGFGMETPEPFSSGTGQRSEVIFRNAGFAVSTQTHSVDAAIARVQRLAQALGIRQRIDAWDLRRFAFSAKWFGKNPLMMVKLISYTGDLYENQFVYALKIRIAAAHLLMLHALSIETDGPLERYRSSSFVNNFETLDIAHYLIGEAIRGEPMSTRRVPMNVSPLELARLSDIAATLSTDALATARMRRFQLRIARALKLVERGYFLNVNLAVKSKPENRIYRRLVTALDWFRQSFSARANESEAVIALAVALETLLTDQFAPGISNRLRRRVGICMKGVPGTLAYQDSVASIYAARSEIVHSGAPDKSIEIHLAQVAFIRCFCAIAARLETWTATGTNAMGNLLGDTAAS